MLLNKPAIVVDAEANGIFKLCTPVPLVEVKEGEVLVEVIVVANV